MGSVPSSSNRQMRRYLTIDVLSGTGSVTETVTVQRKTYPQSCWRSYNASQVHEREYVERLLRALCAGIPQPPRKPGPGRKPLPIADIVFAVILKGRAFTRRGSPIATASIA